MVDLLGSLTNEEIAEETPVDMVDEALKEVEKAEQSDQVPVAVYVGVKHELRDTKVKMTEQAEEIAYLKGRDSVATQKPEPAKVLGPMDKFIAENGEEALAPATLMQDELTFREAQKVQEAEKTAATSAAAKAETDAEILAASREKHPDFDRIIAAGYALMTPEQKAEASKNESGTYDKAVELSRTAISMFGKDPEDQDETVNEEDETASSEKSLRELAGKPSPQAGFGSHFNKLTR